MFTNLKGNDIISNLKNNKFDLLVIGGGITGAGIALDVTAGGLNTAVLEMHQKSNLPSLRGHLQKDEVALIAMHFGGWIKRSNA